MTADLVGWVAFALVALWFAGILGFLAGRDAAERAAERTIADLRLALMSTNRRAAARSRYLTDREGAPE